MSIPRDLWNPVLARERLGGTPWSMVSLAGPHNRWAIYESKTPTHEPSLVFLAGPAPSQRSPLLKTQLKPFLIPESLQAILGLIDRLIWALLALSICVTI